MFKGPFKGFQEDKGLLFSILPTKEADLLSLSDPMTRHSFIAFVLLISLIGCKKPEDRSCFKGSGDPSTEERSFPGLRQVRLFDVIDYTFIQDSADKVVIKAGANLLDFIQTDFNDGVLTIADDNTCRWMRALPTKVEVEIHFTELDLVYNESAGTSRSQGAIRQERFDWENWHTNSKTYLELEGGTGHISTNAGSSLIEITGNAEHMEYYLSGACQIKGQGLNSITGYAHNVGSGDILLTVNGGLLSGNIESHGNIVYYGEPNAIEIYSDTGGGELIHGE
jgi:hypothetical protein